MLENKVHTVCDFLCMCGCVCSANEILFFQVTGNCGICDSLEVFDEVKQPAVFSIVLNASLPFSLFFLPRKVEKSSAQYFKTRLAHSLTVEKLICAIGQTKPRLCNRVGFALKNGRKPLSLGGV